MEKIKYDGNDKNVSFENGDFGKQNTKKTPGFVWLLAFFAAIGGFLFGYDTGVVSGAMLLVNKRFNLSSLMQEIVVSATIAFAIVFALVGGVLNDFFGRKITIIIAGFVFTAGAIVLGVAQNVLMLVVGRSILGMGIGLASMTVPIYIAECAPVELRGRLVTINNLFITGGQFIASVIDGGFSYVDDGWRYMFGLAGLPSIIQFIGMFFMPESPRWLMKKGKEDETRAVLQKIRGRPDVGNELKDIQESCMEEEKTKQLEGDRFVLFKVFTTPAVRRAVIVGCGLQLFQQLSGINTVMYYSATIIRMSGVRDASTAIWLSAMTAGVNFVFTLVGVWLVERIGRKKLITGSLIGVFLSLIVLAIGFQLAAFNSPPISMEEGNFSCMAYSYCEGCIEDKTCGFCYEETDKGSAVNGSCLVTTEEKSSQSFNGRCNSSSLPNKLVWAYDYCPTNYSWMGIMGLALYLMFFAPGMGPMPWTINSEIYPLWARSTGNALSTATNWAFNLIVSMTFLTLTETITKYGTYWLFVGIVFLAIVFMIVLLPETKGKRLEEVEELFSKPWCTCCGENESNANSTLDTKL